MVGGGGWCLSPTPRSSSEREPAYHGWRSRLSNYLSDTVALKSCRLNLGEPLPLVCLQVTPRVTDWVVRYTEPRVFELFPLSHCVGAVVDGGMAHNESSTLAKAFSKGVLGHLKHGQAGMLRATAGMFEMPKHADAHATEHAAQHAERVRELHCGYQELVSCPAAGLFIPAAQHGGFLCPFSRACEPSKAQVPSYTRRIISRDELARTSSNRARAREGPGACYMHIM